jgi:hypothetical protein
MTFDNPGWSLLDRGGRLESLDPTSAAGAELVAVFLTFTGEGDGDHPRHRGAARGAAGAADARADPAPLYRPGRWWLPRWLDQLLALTGPA